MRRRWFAPIHISGLVFSLLMASQGRAGEIVSLREMAPDKACGPRCLYALMQITHEGKPECGIKCIYELIGREPFSVTSIKEIKDAALKLGFSAKGYMLSVEGLAKTKGYAILPLGSRAGTAKDPLHFVLVRRVTKGYVVFVDTKTLQYRAFPASELKDAWNGYALVITAGKGMKPLGKDGEDVDALVKLPKRGNYDEVRDFGPADKGSSLEHTFTIPQTNGKDCTAKIVQKSCSCLAARLGRDIRGQNTLTMTLHVDKAGWQEAHAVVLLEPGGLIKKYAVRAYGKDAFRVHPRKAHIEAPKGGVIEYAVTIEYFTGPNDIIRFDRIAANIPNLSAAWVTSARSVERDTATFRFDVPLIFDAGEPSAEAKDIGGIVNFILNTGNGDRTVPLEFTARIGIDKFRLTPTKLFLIVSKTGGKPIEKRAKVEFLSKLFPTNIAARSDDAAYLDIGALRSSEGVHIVKVVVRPEKLKDLPTGMNKARIMIAPEGITPSSSIVLPVSIFVRE